jgi:hypothetical protein
MAEEIVNIHQARMRQFDQRVLRIETVLSEVG